MPKAYSYIRFSSPEQAKGDSYRRQRKAAEAYCAQHNLELAVAKEYTFFDKGRSAYTASHLDDEGQLRRFLNLVEDGSIEPGSYLLIESLDRLSREKVSVAFPRFLDLINKGITVVTLADARAYSLPINEMDLIISIVHMSRAHNESSLKGQRISAAWTNKKELARSDNKPLGRACPYWLELKDGLYQQIPDRVKTINLIFDLTINGYGQTAISKLLNERSIPIFGSRVRNASAAWGTSSVSKILNNRALLGEYQPTHVLNGVRVSEGEPVLGFYPPVVTEETFYLARSARGLRRLSGASRQSKRFNVWQGIARCFDCDAAMHLVNKGKPPKGYTYLQCHSARKGICSSGMLRLDRTELAFREILAKVDSLSLVQDSSNAIRKSLAAIEGKLATLATKLASAEAAYNEVPTGAGARLLQSTEQEQERLKAAHVEQSQRLQVERVISKEDFFERLDLTSYEGRAAANSLLKRLGLRVLIERGSRDVYHYSLIDTSIATVVDANFSGLILDLQQVGADTFHMIGTTSDLHDLQLMHGDATLEQVQAMQWSGFYRGATRSDMYATDGDDDFAVETRGSSK
ncbi:recombinase family protein [Pseudomonas sp. NPDC047963]